VRPAVRLKRLYRLASLAVLLFAWLFLSCAGEPPPEPESPLEHSLAEHFGEVCADDLNCMLERGYIRVLVSLNRTNFFISDGEMKGYEYSLLNEYEKSLQERFGASKVALDFIPVNRDELIPKLVEGYGDIAAAGLTVTLERAGKVSFTYPYMRGVDEVVVVNRSVKGLSEPEDLSGRKVFVRESSSYYESLLMLNRRLVSEGMPPAEIVLAPETLETEDILEMVNSGAVDITVADAHIADIWSQVLENINALFDVKLRRDAKIAWAVRKGSPKLAADINSFMGEYRKGTLLGNIYFERYWVKNHWIRNPLEVIDNEERSRKVELFKKFGDRYGFDWMLLMATAFQESGWDNSLVSPAGAVGIMQIRPSTASDGNVGVEEIEKLENNIHAGAKYLAFIRDRYFGNGGLDEAESLRFTLAAYNAGPAKVAEARDLAERMGLDRDVWFRNVELAMLRLVGRQPVEYVGNINKYYIIFRMQDHQRLRRNIDKENSQ